MDSNITILKEKEKDLPILSAQSGITEQKRYRVIALMIFCVACSLLVMRIIINLVAPLILETDLSPYAKEAIIDVLFTIPAQILSLVVMPVLFYKFGLKMRMKQMIKFSNFRKTPWYNYLLSIAIGFIGYFVVLGIVIVWVNVLIWIGWSPSGGESAYPAAFHAGYFLLAIFLTGVLPGFCEEFTMRGGFMNTIRGSFRFPVTIVLIGLAFGLFHQNVGQVFFTFLMGILLAAITLKLKSIWPAIIIHFVHNSFSVYLSYAYEYDLFLGGYGRVIDGMFDISPFLFYIVFVIFCALYFGICFLLFYLNSTKHLSRKKEKLLDSGFDVTNKKVVLVGEHTDEEIKELDLEKEIHGKIEEEQLYKPSLRDNAFYIGAIVIAGLTTVFTFVWGLVV